MRDYFDRTPLDLEAMSLRDLTPGELAEALPSILRLQAESDSQGLFTEFRIRMAVERLAEAKALAGARN